MKIKFTWKDFVNADETFVLIENNKRIPIDERCIRTEDNTCLKKYNLQINTSGYISISSFSCSFEDLDKYFIMKDYRNINGDIEYTEFHYLSEMVNNNIFYNRKIKVEKLLNSTKTIQI